MSKKGQDTNSDSSFEDVVSLLEEVRALSKLEQDDKTGFNQTLASVATELKNAKQLRFVNRIASVESNVLDSISNDNKEAFINFDERRKFLNQLAEAVRTFTNSDLVSLYEYSTAGRPKANPGRDGDFYHPDAMITEMKNSDVVFKFSDIDKPMLIENSQKDKTLTSKRTDRKSIARFAVREEVKTTAILPIFYANRNKEGLLFLNSRQENAFTITQLYELQEQLDKLAAILHNIRIYRDTFEYNKQLETLFQVIQKITQDTGDPKLILQSIIDGVVDIIGASRGAIMLWNNNLTEGEVLSESKLDKKALSYLGKKLDGKSKLSRQIFSSEITTISDFSKEKRFPKKELEHFIEGDVKSSIFVPVKSDEGQIIATIGVDETRYVRMFSVQEQSLCKILANQTAIALQLSESLNQLDLSRRAIELQQDVMDEAILETASPFKIYEKLLFEGIKLLKADEGQLFFLNEQADHLIARVSSNKLEVGITHPIDNSISGLAVKEKHTIRINNLELSDRYKAFYQPGYIQNMLSEIAVPLSNKGQIIGVFNVESKKEGAFSDDDQEFVEVLAERVVKVLNLVERLGDLDALSALNDTMGSVIRERGQNQSKQLQDIIKHGKRLADANIVQLLEFDKDKNQLEIINSSHPKDVGIVVQINQSVTGIAFQEKSLINVKNLKEDSHPKYGPYKDLYQLFGEAEVRAAKNDAIKSELSVPLIFGDDVVGILNFESSRVHAFTDQHERLVERMAIQAAAILMLSQMFELEKAKNELELREAQARDVADIMHRLNNPLGAVQQYAQFAAERAEVIGIEDITLKEDISNILVETKEIVGLIEKLRGDLRDIDAYSLHIPTEIDKAIRKFKRETHSQNVTINLNFEDKVQNAKCGNKLGQVLFDLLKNSFEAFDGKKGQINIKCQQTDKQIVASINDNGKGIPERALEFIFEDWFYMTKKEDGIEAGRGLGLYWAKRFLNAYDADIQIDSEFGTGTTVTLTFQHFGT